MELAKTFTLELPSRWSVEDRSHADAVKEIAQLGIVLSRGIDALHGVYMRITDLIREHKLTAAEIRSALGDTFPPPRVSEFILVANAPENTYRRYKTGFVGFKATLQECRGYRIAASDDLRRRKIRRTAERLVLLLGPGEVEVRGRRVVVV